MENVKLEIGDPRKCKCGFVEIPAVDHRRHPPSNTATRSPNSRTTLLAEFHNPVCIVTKNILVTRDIDLLSELAKHNAAEVNISAPFAAAN
jgi:hypothetical protein